MSRVCYAFTRGECDRGDGCRFSHEADGAGGDGGARGHQEVTTCAMLSKEANAPEEILASSVTVMVVVTTIFPEEVHQEEEKVLAMPSNVANVTEETLADTAMVMMMETEEVLQEDLDVERVLLFVLIFKKEPAHMVIHADLLTVKLEVVVTVVVTNQEVFAMHSKEVNVKEDHHANFLMKVLKY